MNEKELQRSYADISCRELQAKISELKTLTKLENESTTRLRAIDTILFDILAWEKKAVDLEKYC